MAAADPIIWRVERVERDLEKLDQQAAKVSDAVQDHAEHLAELVTTVAVLQETVINNTAMSKDVRDELVNARRAFLLWLLGLFVTFLTLAIGIIVKLGYG